MLTGFTYGSHYCSVDNKANTTTLACGYFNSGILVFDVRDPVRPKEIAYYNPAGVITPSPGSNHGVTSGNPMRTCQDNGVLVMKFRKGVWLFPDSRTPPGGQN